MPTPLTLLSTVMLCLLSCLSARALELRAYDATVHDRFVNFPEAPSFNPGFLLESEKLTGIGWDSQSTHKQFALISRCHVLFAAHAAPAVGSRISFLSTSGAIIERSVAKSQQVRNPTQSTSDLLLITLSSPIDRDEGIDPLPFLNLPSADDYAGLPLVILGSQAKAGEGSLIDFRTINVNWVVSRTYRFDYINSTGNSDDARLASGDSGSPTLTTVDGRPALLGVHLATSSQNGIQSNYDAFIPHYIEQIDALMAEDGFRMRPLTRDPANLACQSSLASPSALQGQALALDFTLTNTGTTTTGNLEVEVTFDAKCAPDSVSADGWLSSGSGTQWTLRRAVLDAETSSTIHVEWASAPMLPSIQPSIRWVSDSTAEESLAPLISLATGYSAWAADLGQGGKLDDPDKDGVPNLIEYAFGSNPLSGASSPADGHPPQATFTVSAGIASYSYPERTDMVERSLSYSPEWLVESESGGWSRSLPSGFSSTTTPYVPDISGFSRRVLSWPLQPNHRILRLDISENP